MIHYGEDKRLYGQNFDFPFAFTTEWYDYQKDFMNAFDPTLHTKEALYCDRASIAEVVVFKEKKVLRENAAVALYGDRITVDETDENARIFPFSEVTAVTVLGRNKLNIYHNKQVYQLKGDKRFNALKYVHIYYRSKNVSRGDENGKFLGL